MQQRVSLITLGVEDHAAARSFYERLGWRCTLEVDGTVFFQAGCMILALWSREKLARDARISDPGGWGGVALAYNVASEAEVDRTIDEARGAGARISREPQQAPWGGYTGVFVDPDGHPWEVAHNPGFRLHEDGSIEVSPGP